MKVDRDGSDRKRKRVESRREGCGGNFRTGSREKRCEPVRSDRSSKKGKGAFSIWAVHGLILSSDARIVGLYS